MSVTTDVKRSPSLATYLAELRRQVDLALDRYLPATDAGEDCCCPPRLAEAMRYSVIGGGKRLRPLLVLLAAEACGGSRERAMPAACALEMVHTYSLIHDDLPAMDNDDLRRGRPTCHRAFDEATAILAGDALLTLAFEVIARHVQPAEAAVECTRLLAEASGPSGMAGGQMVDLESEGKRDGSIAELEAIHRRKTGALLQAALRIGGVLGGANATQAEALDGYGRSVGLAFQIVDDLLDVEGDESKMGKRTRKDSGLGKWTYPGLLGIEASRARARGLVESALDCLASMGPGGHRLRELAWELLDRDR